MLLHCLRRTRRVSASERTARCRASTMRRLVLALLVLLVAGCGARRADTAAAVDGRQTIVHGGLQRSYLLRVPPGVMESRGPVPLVIVLHGGGGNGANAETMTGFTAKARAERFMVVYPDGTARGRLPLLTWNAGHCCGHAMDAQVDDVGFLSALIDHLADTYPIDARRVYVTGMSNGAMMSHRVGRELGGRIAAIAPVVGGLFGDETAGRGTVSAIMINGMLDRSVPYHGGAPGGRFAGSWDGTPVQPALRQGTFWANVNGCSADARTMETARYVHVLYDCPSALGVELYGVKDNGHAWPGGQRGSAAGDPPSDALHATDVIWAFFAAHPKR